MFWKRPEAAAAVAASSSKARQSWNSMFDCPAHSQTSPKRTRSSVRVSGLALVFDDACAMIVCSREVVVGVGGSRASQCHSCPQPASWQPDPHGDGETIARTVYSRLATTRTAT